MASGDAITWEYDIPSGQTAFGEIWIDLNDNGTIDPASDKTLFIFTQTDGDTNGNGGPPDMDGTANGHIIFSQPVGLAPAKYIMKFSHNSVGASVSGTVTPLLSPNRSISGTVTPPLGESKLNILVDAEERSDTTNQGDGGMMFWQALTDANGFYTIYLHSDLPTSYWRVRVNDNFAPSIPNPESKIVTLTGNTAGIHFGYIAPSAQVAGTVLDENLSPLPNVDVYISADTGNTYFNSRSDQTGFFQIGIPAGSLGGHPWHLQTVQNGMTTTTFLQARITIPVINVSDSVYRNLIVYSVNSQIEGYVTVDGNPPGFPLPIVAESEDTAQATTYCDPSTGHFVIPVSDKLSLYTIWTWNVPFNWNVQPLTAQAGDTGKILTIISTSVIERGTGIPYTFNLYQNFPNPFNPATDIRYDLPVSSHVNLAIYNILGQEVAKLVDEPQIAGTYTAHFDAAQLPSGVYVYRITAGRYWSAQKMVLLK
jgi:hypothetical protein